MQNTENILRTKSEQLFIEAQRYIPGGVNSPVRAFKAVGDYPRFIARADGAYLYDVDGHRYIDYVGSWGPMILGHNHPAILQAVMTAVHQGLSYGAPCEAEVLLAREITRCVPSIEMVRMVNSGTEAAMSAIRLARGFTGRAKFIKFESCYHGHADSLLVKAGSGALTFGSPTSPGVPAGTVADTLVARFNDLDSVEALFKEHGHDIAAIIVEPIAGNMNLILPQPGFLKGLREICDAHQSLLIFDEVITGFRVGLAGAQGYYGIKPDITLLGKIIGGGMPVGAFGGRREIMEALSPQGAVYQAGTLSGNPIAMAAGLAGLKELQKPGVYQELDKSVSILIKGLLECAQNANIALSVNQSCGLFGIFFSKEESIRYYEQVKNCDITRFQRFFTEMLNQGIYLAPSAFECAFISTAHGAIEISRTLEAAEKAFSRIR